MTAAIEIAHLPKEQQNNVQKLSVESVKSFSDNKDTVDSYIFGTQDLNEIDRVLEANKKEMENDAVVLTGEEHAKIQVAEKAVKKQMEKVQTALQRARERNKNFGIKKQDY